MSADPVADIVLDIVEATPRTRWVFLTLTTESGLVGQGEATLQGEEAALASLFPALAALARGLPDASPAALPVGRALPGLADAALHGALDQALWDVAARRAGQPLAVALGGMRRPSVPVYANINRRTRDRSPAGFAASAREARAAGFTAYKIAPFDEVTPERREAGEARAAAAPGLARIAAVREAIGTEAELLVDCHWRFDVDAATVVLDACAERGVCWFECPLPETEAMIPALRALRARAHRHAMRLAGGEKLIRLEQFAPFIAAGAYDVLMPDVKYVGGLAEAIALAERMATAGIAFSPHNPSGPIAHAASVQLCAASPALDRLEMQWDETPLFTELTHPAPPLPERGVIAVPADRPGIGVVLDRALAARHAPIDT
jgi:galactonate dehydratase